MSDLDGIYKENILQKSGKHSQLVAEVVAVVVVPIVAPVVAALVVLVIVLAVADVAEVIVVVSGP